MAPKVLLLALLQALVQAEKIVVQVGAGGQLTFSPNSTTANLGDTIEFQFLSHNHTATQGDPTKGCAPASTVAAQCYDSGYVPVTDRNSTIFYTAENTTDIGIMTVPVGTTDTMFFYCAQADHCQESMVFAVNPQVYSTRITLKEDANAEEKGQNTLSNYETLCSGATVNEEGPAVRAGTATGNGVLLTLPAAAQPAALAAVSPAAVAAPGAASPAAVAAQLAAAQPAAVAAPGAVQPAAVAAPGAASPAAVAAPGAVQPAAVAAPGAAQPAAVAAPGAASPAGIAPADAASPAAVAPAAVAPAPPSSGIRSGHTGKNHKSDHNAGTRFPLFPLPGVAPGIVATIENGWGLGASGRSPLSGLGALFGLGGRVGAAPAAAPDAAAPPASPIISSPDAVQPAAIAAPPIGSASPATAAPAVAPVVVAPPAAAAHWKRRAEGYGSSGNPFASAANVAADFFPTGPLGRLVGGPAAVAVAATEPIAAAAVRAGAAAASALGPLAPAVPAVPAAVAAGSQGSNGQQHGGLLNPKVAGRPSLGNGFFGSGFFGNGGNGGDNGASSHSQGLGGGVGGGVGAGHSGAAPAVAAPDTAAPADAAPAAPVAPVVAPVVAPAIAPVVAAPLEPAAAAPVAAAQSVPWTG